VSLATKRIARVFPRRTNATPTDNLAFAGPPPMLFPIHVDEVHVSVAFTWDLPHARWLAKQWEPVAPVRIGGPATDMRGEEFIPGRYLKPGYVITSRGCPRRCWFCSAWRRDGTIRELPIRDGVNVLDDNLLACSDEHVREVFVMLRHQNQSRYDRIQFTGGLEPSLLQDWHIEALRDLKPDQAFFAYDTPDDLEPLCDAGRRMREAGFTRRTLRCYVLIGGPTDTLEAAELRLNQTLAAGFFPMAMLWRNERGRPTRDRQWRSLQRRWARPAIIAARTAS
jgi:hypothetical protein